MYQIKLDGSLLYDPRLEERLVRDPTAHLAVNEAGSLDFTLDTTHPLYSTVQPRQGVVELVSDGSTIFRGRIIKISYDFYNSKVIECEGLLACLNDSVIPPHSYPADWANDSAYQAAEASGNVVEFYLKWLLEKHNAQVTSAQQIKLGNVTVKDSNNYLYRSSDGYNSTWATVKDKLFDSSLGGNLLTRYESDGVYLDYVDELPLTNTQPIEFAKNLLDLTDEADTTDTYTDILPTGADGITIADLADGAIDDDLVKAGNIIYSISAREKYGNIVSIQTWDEVTDAENLKTKAAEQLAQTGVKLSETITVSAVDLGLVEEDVAQFRVGRMCQIVSKPHSLADTYPLTQLDLDLVSPENTQITLGVTQASYSERQRDEFTRVDNLLELQQTQLDAAQEQLNGVYEEISTQITQVIQTSREIIFTALEDYAKTSDVDSLRETVSAQLAVMADNITINISAVTQQITDVQGDLQAQISTINKYFRFTTDGLYIGEEGNELLLRVDNDIVGFYDGGLRVAYFSDKQLVVTDANFLNSLQLGKFAFLPRASGNLSLVKVGD